MSDTKPVYKFINNAWVKQDAFQFTNGSWVRISAATTVKNNYEEEINSRFGREWKNDSLPTLK